MSLSFVHVAKPSSEGISNSWPTATLARGLLGPTARVGVLLCTFCLMKQSLCCDGVGPSHEPGHEERMRCEENIEGAALSIISAEHGIGTGLC